MFPQVTICWSCRWFCATFLRWPSRSIDRRCHHSGSSTPQSSCPAAASFLPGRGGRPGPACVGQNGQPKWRPESFFSFLRHEVEIPRRREVETLLRTRRLWLRPNCEEVPAKLTIRAFPRPKWRGCSPQANLWGFFPPTTTVGLQSIFSHVRVSRAQLHQSLLDKTLVGSNRETRLQALMRFDFACPARVTTGEPAPWHSGGGEWNRGRSAAEPNRRDPSLVAWTTTWGESATPAPRLPSCA